MGFICGIVLAQEVPTIPKLRPYFDSVWNKLKDSNASNPTNEGSSDNSSKND